MEIIDIHSHNIDQERQDTIYNLIFPQATLLPHLYYSVGIHPWHIPKQIDWSSFEELVNAPNILAVGEAGIDKIRGFDLTIQTDVFIRQAQIAESVKKPLIIHMVKSQTEIIKIHKEINPKQTWIIHGFRGKPEQLNQLNSLGIEVSLGNKYNHKTALSISHILAETDDSNASIEDILEKLATDRNDNIIGLKKEIIKYTKTLFI